MEKNINLNTSASKSIIEKKFTEKSDKTDSTDKIINKFEELR